MVEEFQPSEEGGITLDEVSVVVKDAVDGIVGNNIPYDHSKVQQWSSSIIETCMKRLTQLSKPFKFVVTCLIARKTGAGLHMCSSSYWDMTTDSMLSLKDESNRHLVCIVTVYWVAI